MVVFDSIGQARSQSDPRLYARELSARIIHDFPLSLLPELREVPLPIVDSVGLSWSLEDVLRATPFLTLSGPSGCGRQLALQQFALRWTSQEQGTEPFPLLIALPLCDDGSSPPDVQIAAWTQIMQQPEQKPHRRVLPRLRLGSSAKKAVDLATHWTLLISGWESLPADRRAVWRSALLELAHTNSPIQLVVTLPPDESPWPDFIPLSIAPPTPALINSWVEQLVPEARRAAVRAALAPDGLLHTLNERLFDIALLAWIAPGFKLPACRADLYTLGLAAILGLSVDQLKTSLIVRELQLLAAYNEQPIGEYPDLLHPTTDDRLCFIHPQARRYLAARQLLDEGRFDLLWLLDPIEREELALLLTTMANDPAPLFAALWRSGRPDDSNVLILGRCLRELPSIGPTWTLRVLGALAALAHDGAPAPAQRAYELLAACLPLLDTALKAAIAVPPATQFLLRLLELLPDDLATPRLERLAYAATTPESLAWTLADLLADRPTLAETASPAAPSDPQCLARWSYVQALRGPATRAQLDPAMALLSLAAAAADPRRRLRMAQALFDDQFLAPPIRCIAPLLLADLHLPQAKALIEQAALDPLLDMRSAALTALARREPARVYEILASALYDTSTPWEARIAAIRQLGGYLAIGAGPLLENCAGDPALPLYVRLQATIALGRQAAGADYLVGIIVGANYHPEVRAEAARQLGAVGDHAASTLIRLIDDPATPAPLREGACDGLSIVGGPWASNALLRLLANADGDIGLMLAAVRALGRAGDAAAIEPLSWLLGPDALERLYCAVEPRLLNMHADDCLADPELPGPISLRLATALAANSAPGRPTTLAEFLADQADQIRIAAAQSLVAIGGRDAYTALVSALSDGTASGAISAIVEAIVEIEGQQSVEGLHLLLNTAEVSPLVRWLAIQHLADHPAGEEAMYRMLAQPDIDPFTRGTLAEALGRRGALTALPLLCQLAEDATADEYLRSQALLALGLLDTPATEASLLRLLGDQAENAGLRGLAAEHLPGQLSEEGRRIVRDILRREQIPPPIVIGALQSVRRTRDREALPLLLRYCQDDQAEIARTAIEAIGDFGDDSVTPILMSVAQSATARRGVRLEAAGALLRLGGAGYRPLLRAYLEHDSLPIRLQALEHLIVAGTSPDELLTMLATPTWPLPVRQRLIDHLADDPASTLVLIGILASNADHPMIRARAAESLGHIRSPAATATLIQLAKSVTTAIEIRLRCIDALGACSDTEAWLALSRLAEADTEQPVLRDRAIRALRAQIAEEEIQR